MSETPRLYTCAAPAPWSLVSLSGRDVRDFLQRLTTVDLRKLETGQGAQGFFLEPKGRIVAAFTLWRLSETEFALEFDAGAEGGWRNQLITAIDKFHFGEDLTLSEVSAQGKLECRWFFSEGEAPGELGRLESMQTSASDEEIRVFRHGDRQYGRAWFTAWGRPARLAQWAERSFDGARPTHAAQFERWRIDSLGAAVDHEITTDSNPLEIGMRAGVAEQKGCYPGQEVLEKILALGSPARRLVRLEGSGQAPPTGTPVTNLAEPPADVGTITSSYAREDGTAVALAVVRKIHAKPGLEVRAEPDFAGRVSTVAPYESQA